ncbi:MAG: NAD-dependent epimerase/dehydratase family protein [Bacteroidetes bacterium]|nr:MAG: NAD-dependent epimerase/dehydratase family protein [Bacteroidota bacterium]
MILVTGGTGLLGSHLLFELLKKNLPVRAIWRNEARKEMVKKIFSYYTDDPNGLFGKIEWKEADLLDPVAMEDALEGITEVFHAGAIVSFYPEDQALMRKVNIHGTANLVNLSLVKGVEKFCYVSSIATLGRAENDGQSDESTYWVPSKKNSVYSQTKYAAEQEVWRGMAEGLQAVIVNPSVILGPGYWQDNSGLFRLVYEGLKYYTRGINGYVDVRDVARAMIDLMDRDLLGERFIVSADNLSYEQLFTLMARYLGKPAPSVHVASAMTRIAWRVEAVRSFITRSKPEVTREMATTSAQIYTYSNRKIRERLGIEFITPEESIREISAFFLADINPGPGSGSDSSG